MAEVSKKVIAEKFKGKLLTITEFRKKYAEGVSSQAVNYAIEHDLIDYVDIGPRVRAIVLTEKTLKYAPNKSKKRNYKSRMSV